MAFINPRTAEKGSWLWTLRIAELIAWGTAGVVAIVLAGAGLPSSTLWRGAGLLVLLSVWNLLLFRWVLPRARTATWAAPTALTGALLLAAALFIVVRDQVGSAQLVFVPVVVVMGVLTGVVPGVIAASAAALVYVASATAADSMPPISAVAVNGGLFLLTGAVAGALARELRTHYRGEREEHRLATAVRHRLLAVLDAVDEAIVFRDRQGVARVVNRRAGDLFGIDPDAFLGSPVVELLRAVARQTEDPEGFMETFQELRDDPDLELRSWIEQIIPERRLLRLYSAPTSDESGELVGRIDVYTDVTEGMARSLEIESLYERARETAESYQRSLLPESVPALPRLSLVAHYVPAAGRRAVCGDFYDFVTLGDGRMCLVLGDVCGVGPPAANDAALTRYSLRSFMSDESDLTRLMERMNTHINRHMSSERFVRLLLAAIDPERAQLDYVVAGHVPPVVYRAETADVEWLQEGGMVLGVDEDVTFKAGHIELKPADSLVFYTDGVTEAHRDGRPFGQGKFSDLVKEYGVGTPGEMVQAIRRSVEMWTFGSEQRDDLALICAQVVPDKAIHDPVRELVLPNEPVRVGEIRSFVAGFLADLRSPVDVSQEVLLAVGEAAANACRHGRRPQGRSEVRVRCARHQGRVEVLVADDGPGFDPSAFEELTLPDRFASGGRGLFLMRRLMDDVEVDTSDEGTTVTMTRSLTSWSKIHDDD
ncbi:MAG: SpoIIE family protein phosphatase [Actinomycetota bacterium]|nr:SpoIIE family protein phosphatase [Actinomycetota bacterium]